MANYVKLTTIDWLTIFEREEKYQITFTILHNLIAKLYNLTIHQSLLSGNIQIFKVHLLYSRQ